MAATTNKGRDTAAEQHQHNHAALPVWAGVPSGPAQQLQG